MRFFFCQQLKYSNQGDKAQPRNIERLFHYNQLIIGASSGRAVVGTVGNTAMKDFLEWKDTSPFNPQLITQSLGCQELTRRQQLIAGMLHPVNLLDILRHYTLFTNKGGRRVKVVPRYQQFRAVYKTLDRLQYGQTKEQHGTSDQRGGIIWHYQGSGKSLDMVFIVRKLRTIDSLKRFKVVFVTDRIDLEQQLKDTAKLIGQPTTPAKKVKDIAKLLRQKGPGIVFGMIQKFRDTQSEDDNDIENIEELNQCLNDSEEILVLIDEAHRSHSKKLHAYLLKALPKCARIGFTGTPIVSEKKKKTVEIFPHDERPYIDTYSIRESQADKVTVPIFYEGLEARGAIKGGSTLDQLFDVLFQGYTPKQKAEIKAKFATKSAVLKARELLKLKARNILEHYITRVLPGGFKGQVAASDREAAVQYQQFLSEAKDEIIKELEAQASILQGLENADLTTLPSNLQFQVQAYSQLDKIRRLEFAAVISADSKKDPDSWKIWTDQSNQENYIERFKQPFERDGLAFLIVQRMLLTGFDAPLEQVLYLDRNMIEHELLQAIARVNRTAPNKDYGLVVDYYGVDIAAAMSVYDQEDIDGAWFDILQDALPELDEAYRHVMALFQEHNWDINQDLKNFIDLMRDTELRARFNERLKTFLQALDNLLPRPEALRYVKDAKRLGAIKKLVDDAFVPDDKPHLADAKIKVRTLIDNHLQAQGINPKVEPLDILAIDFEERVQQRPSVRTQAAQMEHAIRHHRNVYRDNNPAFYDNLSEELERILQELEDNWEAKAAALIELVRRTRAEETETDASPISRTLRPFYNFLKDVIKNLTPETEAQLLTFSIEMVEYIRQETQIKDFWRTPFLRTQLWSSIWLQLEETGLFPSDQLDALADRLVQLTQQHNL